MFDLSDNTKSIKVYKSNKERSYLPNSVSEFAEYLDKLKFVNIFPSKYQLELRSPIYKETKDKDDMNVMGLVIYNSNLIFLDKCLSPQMLVNVLYHEIFHVFVKYSNETIMSDSKSSIEAIVNTLTADFIIFCKQNKSFIKTLIAVDAGYKLNLKKIPNIKFDIETNILVFDNKSKFTDSDLYIENSDSNMIHSEFDATIYINKDNDMADINILLVIMQMMFQNIVSTKIGVKLFKDYITFAMLLSRHIASLILTNPEMIFKSFYNEEFKRPEVKKD